MSGLFGSDEESAASTLRRAGLAADRTILAAVPDRRDSGTEQVLTPDDVVKKRFPEEEYQRQRRKREEEEEKRYREGVEKLKDEFRRRGLGIDEDAVPRLLFDPRPLGGAPGRFVPRQPPELPSSRFANRGRRGRSST